MLPNLKGDFKPTKELHNYIHKCMSDLIRDFYKENQKNFSMVEERNFKRLLLAIDEKMIKE